jgi:hypothetical protein
MKEYVAMMCSQCESTFDVPIRMDGLRTMVVTLVYVSIFSLHYYFLISLCIYLGYNHKIYEAVPVWLEMTSLNIMMVAISNYFVYLYELLCDCSPLPPVKVLYDIKVDLSWKKGFPSTTDSQTFGE